ncbi:MAG: hypothetical protein J6S92_12915 [Oscillospiraceae bacterium]|nr:hypothetical protein [Oscillospiraceae bacterium]
MGEYLHFEVMPETVQRKDNSLHGICVYWQGKPVVFMYDMSCQDIIIPESLEPVYPAIEDAVMRFLRQTGMMR